MKRLLFLLPLVLMGGREARTLQEIMQLAATATEQQDYTTALQYYTEAETRTNDPGLVAFNKGVVFGKQGQWREAELHFRRSLADDQIPPVRRCRGLFNLGDTLVKQAGETDAKRLQTAIDCYQLVIDESRDADLANDAAHNLELTKLLWAKAITQQPPKERDPAWENPDPPEPNKTPPPTQKKKNTETGPDQADPNPDKNAKTEFSKEKKELPKEQQPASKQVPGSGGLPVINSDQLTITDVDALLERTANRLRQERQKLREESSQGDRFRPNDW